jgi:hypothetical protein
MPPTPELFPGGSWERPWTTGEDGDHLDVPYEAGGAYATIEGTGELTIDQDGNTSSIDVDGPALYPLAEHPRHEQHQLLLKPAPALRIWAISFAAGMP